MQPYAELIKGSVQLAWWLQCSHSTEQEQSSTRTSSAGSSTKCQSANSISSFHFIRLFGLKDLCDNECDTIRTNQQIISGSAKKQVKTFFHHIQDHYFTHSWLHVNTEKTQKLGNIKVECLPSFSVYFTYRNDLTTYSNGLMPCVGKIFSI